FAWTDRAAFAFRGAGSPASRVQVSGWRGSMAQNALLRSVKGLGIPGTARTEARKTKLKVAPPPADDRHDHFAVRNGVRNGRGDHPPADDRHDHFAVRNGVRCA